MSIELVRGGSWGQSIGPSLDVEDKPIDRSRPIRPDEYDPSTLDSFFGLLKNERRRRVVRYLDEESSSTTLSDLAEHIAAIENDKPERELRAQERKRVYIQLYQYHLPAMDKAGVIEFDNARGTVERNPMADHLVDLLGANEASSPVDDPSPPKLDSRPSEGRRQSSTVPAEGGIWSIYYLGLGLVGVGLFVLQWSNPIADLVSGAIAGVLLMAVVSCSLVRASTGRAYRAGALIGKSGTKTGPPASQQRHQSGSVLNGRRQRLTTREAPAPTSAPSSQPRAAIDERADGASAD